MSEFAVKAETHEGATHMLRRGFTTREDAEDHPVKMKLWKRVWVEKIADGLSQDHSAPLPWTIVHVRHLTYLADANGKKVASLLGTKKRMENAAALIIRSLAQTDERTESDADLPTADDVRGILKP